MELKLVGLACNYCGEIYEALAEPEGPSCAKCGTWHRLCPACWSVHLLSASEQGHYLASLEAL